MMADLAASGGCLLEPGDSGVNNPLAQFSRSVVDGGRQQAEALASAPSGPPALHAHGVGPALPPLGAEEAAFLDERALAIRGWLSQLLALAKPGAGGQPLLATEALAEALAPLAG